MSTSINDIKNAVGHFLTELQKPGLSTEEAKDLVERAKAVAGLGNVYTNAGRIELEQAKFMAEHGMITARHHDAVRQKFLSQGG